MAYIWMVNMYDRMKKTVILIAIFTYNVSLYAQAPASGFIQLPGGVEYKMLKDVAGDVTPKNGDYVESHMYVEVDGNLIYNSREVNENKPVSFLMQEPKSKTDIQEVIKLMSAGDSVVIKFSVDSLLKTGIQKLDWMKPNTGQKATYYVKVSSVRQLGKKEK